jgi:hypothetical protein
MTPKFYDAGSEHDTNHDIYRELILTDREPTTEHVKSLRPSSWAVCTFRAARHITDEAALQGCEFATTLVRILGPQSESGRSRRYDRVIILKTDARDDIAHTLAFFAKWLPDLVAQRRVFIADASSATEQTASLSKQEAAIFQAIGIAEPDSMP